MKKDEEGRRRAKKDDDSPVLSGPATPVDPPEPCFWIASELPTIRPEQNRANGAGTCFIDRLTVVGRRGALSRQIAGPRARSASQGLP
jgi:hypothetical protein